MIKYKCIFILILPIYAIIVRLCVLLISGLLFKGSDSQKTLYQFKKYKGLLYLILGFVNIWSIFFHSDRQYAALVFTAILAFCEGLGLWIECNTFNIEKQRERKQDNNIYDNSLKKLENLIAELRLKLNDVEIYSKRDCENLLRQSYYELKELLKTYHEADLLMEELKAVVYAKKPYDRILIMTLLDEFEDLVK